KPWAEQDADPKEVTPKFQEYVAEQLRKAGVEGENIERYENANPAWMSVAGLIRYWKKYGNE
ncbi:MAG: MBL fold metallo-hydrolase, partial [Bacteroidetes bacterium]